MTVGQMRSVRLNFITEVRSPVPLRALAAAPRRCWPSAPSDVQRVDKVSWRAGRRAITTTITPSPMNALAEAIFFSALGHTLGLRSVEILRSLTSKPRRTRGQPPGESQSHKHGGLAE
jgi:hypothetical protein